MRIQVSVELLDIFDEERREKAARIELANLIAKEIANKLRLQNRYIEESRRIRYTSEVDIFT
jgi:predicted nucleic acid-binding protein